MITHPCIESDRMNETCHGCLVYKNSLCGRFQTLLKKIVGSLNKKYSSIPESDREDILTNMVEGVITGVERFEGRHGAKFSTWAYRIFRNKIHDYFRKKGHHTIEIDETKIPDSPGQDSIKKTIAECFRKTLPDDHSGCIRLFLDLYIFFMNGQTQKELAVSYHMKANTLNQRIKRCREKISQLFREYME